MRVEKQWQYSGSPHLGRSKILHQGDQRVRQIPVLVPDGSGSGSLPPQAQQFEYGRMGLLDVPLCERDRESGKLRR